MAISWPAAATPMMTLSPQPLWQHSSAARITCTLPMHSNEKSTPPSVSATMTSCTGLSLSLGLTQSVAPHALAAANLSGLVSTAMMRDAPTSTAASMQARPTAPRPNTATVLPACTLAVLCTAPQPVVTPQPSRHTLSSGAAGDTLAQLTSWITAEHNQMK